MTILFLLVIVAACSIFYLSLPQQKFLTRPLNRKQGKIAATLLLIVALLSGFSYFSVGTSIFSLIAIAMLILSLLPFASLLKKEARHDH